jgi:signal transduction histidine kinase
VREPPAVPEGPDPAAAAARAVAALREYERARQEALAEIAGVAAGRLAALGAQATQRSVPEPLGPLDESDREQELADALNDRGVPDGIAIAAALTEGRLDPGWVDRVQAAVGEERLTAGLRYVAACASARVVLGELEESTTRIADLVGAVRDYSYLDQGPRQTVDIHEGIESTLKLLAHKLGDSRVEIVRDFDPGLPTVEASGSELNQVWTNLIDNALDAVGDAGQITLRTRPPGPRHRAAHRRPQPRRAAPRVKARRHAVPGPAADRVARQDAPASDRPARVPGRPIATSRAQYPCPLCTGWRTARPALRSRRSAIAAW